MAEDTTRRELSEEEYESLSPSDRAHYDIKGRLGDGLTDEDSDATKTARAAAFEMDNAQATPDDEVDVDARHDELEAAKADADVSGSDDTVDTSGIAGTEAAGVGTGDEAQTAEEASAAEEARREEMSDAELAEAETRDRVAEGLEPDDRESGSVPNVGSPDEEGREDGNLTDAVVGPNESFGTAEDERTAP